MKACGVDWQPPRLPTWMMRAAGLVANRKEGLNVHYRIADPRVFEMMQALEAIFCRDGKPQSHEKA
jgi:hypothetical protein